ncbi:ABC transporter substrate-binding protein [Microbacterium halophytorum]|uniref:ABC transporter substrate-binding protein n=1 Tax=Microbacterium halophytorum TaxID=2067568 RepID=UPI000CFE298E|nr:extracellular solute-binding protein [Microbacterium halophytorum]
MRTRHYRSAAAIAAATTIALATAGCGGGGGAGAEGKTTITLAGPNQWNSQADSFGPAWESMIERFEEAEPGIDVETTVLPISSFADTLSTQLAAGTAPELIFGQTPHNPDQVTPLTEYLEAPNPYVEGNERWLDMFDENYYGDAQRNGSGDLESVPLNLVIAGIFYNEDAFAEAGVDGDVETFEDLIGACNKLSDAGYTPMAMDSGSLGAGWISETIYAMLLDKYVAEWDQYAADGTEGTAGSVTWKSLSKAILTGELDATETPEVAESLRLTKEVYDACATPNWSGIPPTSTFVGGDEFLAGDAAMAWGTNFNTGTLADVDWEWSSFGFPTITTETTPLSSGATAKFGAAAGGTNYMIPATVTGDQLDAAVKFLQFATSPDGGQAWLDETGGIPATVDAKPAPGVEDLMAGDWALAKSMNLSGRSMANAGKNILDGYLLETKTLDEQLDALEGEWTTWAQETAEKSGWSEDWATQ